LAQWKGHTILTLDDTTLDFETCITGLIKPSPGVTKDAVYGSSRDSSMSPDLRPPWKEATCGDDNRSSVRQTPRDNSRHKPGPISPCHIWQTSNKPRSRTKAPAMAMPKIIKRARRPHLRNPRGTDQPSRKVDQRQASKRRQPNPIMSRSAAYPYTSEPCTNGANKLATSKQ
jgi:hypothetical protein